MVSPELERAREAYSAALSAWLADPGRWEQGRASRELYEAARDELVRLIPQTRERQIPRGVSAHDLG